MTNFSFCPHMDLITLHKVTSVIPQNVVAGVKKALKSSIFRVDVFPSVLMCHSLHLSQLALEKLLLLLHPFNGLFSRTTCVGQHQKGI